MVRVGQGHWVRLSDMAETEVEAYEDWTVEELRDELRARDLHTSGSKGELISRLEENDAAEEAEETSSDDEEVAATSTDLVPTEQEEVPADPHKRIYSPYELPADPFAAQAFMDAHPGDVDTSLKLDSEERQQLAEDNIQDAVDQHAARGTTVEDPRLEGTDAPARAEQARSEVAASAQPAEDAGVDQQETVDAV